VPVRRGVPHPDLVRAEEAWLSRSTRPRSGSCSRAHAAMERRRAHRAALAAGWMRGSPRCSRSSSDGGHENPPAEEPRRSGPSSRSWAWAGRVQRGQPHVRVGPGGVSSSRPTPTRRSCAAARRTSACSWASIHARSRVGATREGRAAALESEGSLREVSRAPTRLRHDRHGRRHRHRRGPWSRLAKEMGALTVGHRHPPLRVRGQRGARSPSKASKRCASRSTRCS